MSKLGPPRALVALVPPSGPQRVYGVSLLVNTFGFGLVFTSMTLYFTRVVHLSTEQVGVGMTIAGLVGLLSSVPAGDLADRRGPREVVRASVILQFLATVGYLFIHDFVAFVVVASVEMISISATESANGPLIRRIGGENAAGYRSTTRAISNVGTSLGALGCGAAIEIGTPTAYRTLIAVNAATFLVAWAILGRLPHYPALPQKEGGPRWGALTDKPFVTFTALSSLMTIQYFVILMSLPLWVVDHTHSPRWSVPGFLLINTVMVALLQVRIGKDVKTVGQGGVALRRAGVLFLISCSAIGLATGLPAWAALLLLVAAVAVHTIGEIWFSSGGFAVTFGLPPANAQGQYMGVATIGFGAGLAIAPVLLIGVVLSFGRLGWAGLGVGFLLLGLAAPAVARWGERSRPAEAEAADAGKDVTTDTEHTIKAD
jgi:hypothetical protein